MITQRLIKPSNSSWCLPVILVIKGNKNKKLQDVDPSHIHFVFDHRSVNTRITELPEHHALGVNEIISEIGSANGKEDLMYSSVDLKAA